MKNLIITALALEVKREELQNKMKPINFFSAVKLKTALPPRLSVPELLCTHMLEVKQEINRMQTVTVLEIYLTFI